MIPDEWDDLTPEVIEHKFDNVELLIGEIEKHQEKLQFALKQIRDLEPLPEENASATMRGIARDALAEKGD